MVVNLIFYCVTVQAKNCVLLYCVILNCIALSIYCYVDIIQYNARHKFARELDNPQNEPYSPNTYSMNVLLLETSVLFTQQE